MSPLLSETSVGKFRGALSWTAVGTSLWRILCSTACCLGLLLACSDGDQLSNPPLDIPIDTQTAGSRVDVAFRVPEYRAFEFGVKLRFREGDDKDRQRVLKLAGDPRRDQAGKLIAPGISIPLRVRLVSLNPSDLEQAYEREYAEQQRSGVSDTDVYSEIATFRLKPGPYRITVENVKVVREIQDTPVSIYFSARPKSTAIPN